MVLALTDVERIAGALLNDIGPVIDPAGIARIASYVGTPARYESWDSAIDDISARIGDIYPDFDRAAWGRFVRRTMREDNGRVVFDYDMKIADTFTQPGEAPPSDTWPFSSPWKDDRSHYCGEIVRPAKCRHRS